MVTRHRHSVVTLTWRDVDIFAKAVAVSVRESGFSPEIIVGVERGGCIAGVLLSHLLGVDAFAALGIRTTRQEGPHPPRRRPVVYGDACADLVRGRRVLLADDVVNSGRTLRLASSRLAADASGEVLSVVLVRDTFGVRVPWEGIWGATYPAWIVFPWEVPTLARLRRCNRNPQR